MIDTHSHLDFEQFDDDREEVIQRAFNGGVKKIINVGCNLERAKASIELVDKYENIYAAIGIHPTDINRITNYELRITNSEGIKKQRSKENFMHSYLEELRKLARHSKVVAIGEIGLDYFHPEKLRLGASPVKLHYEASMDLDGEIKQLKIRQKELFIAQLELAEELQLPVIIHCRDAYEDLLEILKGFDLRGVIHCFCGNRRQAKQFLDLGFYISFTGNITYSKKDDAEIFQVIKEVPLERIMIETDCPFLAPASDCPIQDGPAPMRGKRNEPLFVKYVAEKIAEIKKISLEEVEIATDENAGKLFKF